MAEVASSKRRAATGRVSARTRHARKPKRLMGEGRNVRDRWMGSGSKDG